MPARAAIAKTDAVHELWRDTGQILKQAQHAYAQAELEEAIMLADRARRQAELSYNQVRLEAAKALLRDVRNVADLTEQQQMVLERAEQAYHGHDGETAYQLAQQLGGRTQ